MLISLAMIVKNEEAALAHCLDSVKALADEIIIVDTGSTDKTIDIARGFGAQVYRFEWRDDFSAARNESLKYCKGDWVFILDADEAVDPADHAKIKDACQNPRADAYSLITRTYTPTSVESSLDAGVGPNVSDYQEGGHLPFYADNTGLRLARLFDGLAFKGRIHETLGQSLASHEKTIGALGAVIHHYGKLHAGREEQKAQYYFTLARQEFDDDPASEQAQFNLLQQALVAKQWETAMEAALAAMKIVPVPKPLVYYGMGLALQELERHGEAINYFDMLLWRNPSHPLATLGKGVSAEALGDVNGGRDLINKAIELQPDYVPSRGRLAELELRANNLDAAREITLGALEIAPNEPALYDLLMRIEATRNNRRQMVRDALLGIKMCPAGGEGRWHRLAAAYLCQAGQLDTALAILDLGLKTFPGDAELMRLKDLI